MTYTIWYVLLTESGAQRLAHLRRLPTPPCSSSPILDLGRHLLISFIGKADVYPTQERDGRMQPPLLSSAEATNSVMRRSASSGSRGSSSAARAWYWVTIRS
jgi:hypothetical protein